MESVVSGAGSAPTPSSKDPSAERSLIPVRLGMRRRTDSRHPDVAEPGDAGAAVVEQGGGHGAAGTGVGGMERLAARLVPDELWSLVEPVLPSFRPRRQGGGGAPLADRTVFTAVVFVVTSGCAWRQLPDVFGVSVPTAHRRFAAWTRAGVWSRMHGAVLDGAVSTSPVTADVSAWARVIVRAATSRVDAPGRVDARPKAQGRGCRDT